MAGHQGSRKQKGLQPIAAAWIHSLSASVSSWISMLSSQVVCLTVRIQRTPPAAGGGPLE